jgi:hypothetical protein
LIENGRFVLEVRVFHILKARFHDFMKFTKIQINGPFSIDADIIGKVQELQG